ncbi:MAG: DNA alkylation repair protein [Chthonomonadales bacterium]
MNNTLPPNTLEEAMSALKQFANETVRTRNIRDGAPDNQFGLTTTDIRTIAKSIKSNHELGLELWGTGNIDAMMLATLIMKPKLLSEDQLDRMTSSISFYHVADYFMTNVTKLHPSKEAMRVRWMESDHVMLLRAGWSLTTERVIKNPDGLDLAALLDRIERELAPTPYLAQWTMNYCLAEIGIKFPEYRKRALDIGEKLGVYREWKVSKGCTSPFAPIWINAIVSRQH